MIKEAEVTDQSIYFNLTDSLTGEAYTSVQDVWINTDTDVSPTGTDWHVGDAVQDNTGGAHWDGTISQLSIGGDTSAIAVTLNVGDTLAEVVDNQGDGISNTTQALVAGIDDAASTMHMIYTRNLAAQVDTRATSILALATTVHTDLAFFHCGNGIWRLDFVDAPFAAGVGDVQLQAVSDVSAFVPSTIEVEFKDWSTDLDAIIASIAALPTPVAIAAAVLAGDVDSTGTPITFAKAMEICEAYAIGNAVYNMSTRRWTIYGRDGVTALAYVTEDGDGNRSVSTVI